MSKQKDLEYIEYLIDLFSEKYKVPIDKVFNMLADMQNDVRQ